MKYINQCYKCNQDFEHTEIIETIAVSTGEDSWEEVVYCKECRKVFREDEPSWYDEQTEEHTCDKCAEEGK